MSQQRSPGRPRDSARGAAILDAALALLAERGYDSTSIEAIAARAGVSKATVYRRWPNKSTLVAAAVERRAPSRPPVHTSPDLRERLLSILKWLADDLTGQEVGLLGAIFAGMRNDPELAAAMRDIRDNDARTIGAIAFDGLDTSQLAPDADTLLPEVATALLVHRIVIAGQHCDENFIAHLADHILLPLLTRPPRRDLPDAPALLGG